MEDLNFDVFEGEQKKVLINMAEQIKKQAADSVQTDDLGFEDSPVVKKDRANLSKIRKIWDNNGYLDNRSEQISLDQLLDKDLQVRKMMRDNFSTDLPLLIPRTISTMVREAIEPNLVLTPLLTRINYSAGTRLSFPTFGGLANAAADLAEGEEYPEGTMEMGGQTECIIGKSGIAVKVTEEQRRYSQFDIISMNVRAAGRALARLKERKVADLITNNATVLINNDDAAARRTTGRDYAGAYNGTLTLDDIFNVWSVMVNTGFVPNTLIMHPFAWKIFAEDGMQKLFGFQNGMQNMLWQLPQGNPGNAPNWRQTMLNQNSYVTDPQNLATTFTRVPSLFPTQFNIIVSPYMPFTASTNKTDIVFCDINELGILVVDEEVTSDEWTDPSKDIMKMKFRERYGLAIKNDGRAVGVLKNITIGKNIDFGNRLSVDYPITGMTNQLTGDAARMA
jgi:HK97 family phage major capsid protein